MVIPEAAWLKQQGCLDASGNVDFRRALDYSNDLRNTIGIIGSLMSEKGMDLTLLESKLDELDAEAARMAVATGKDGAGLRTSELDELSKVANADFLIEVGIFPHAYGPRKQYEIRISGKDTSSLTQFDSQTINSSPSSAPVSELIKEVLLQYIDPFVDKLHAKFDDISRNGREGYLTLKLTEGSPLDFESEVTIGGESGELADAIDMWLDENTVNGQYTKSTGNTMTLKYEHVRLPLTGKGAFGKKEKAIDAEQFGKNLGKSPNQFRTLTIVIAVAAAIIIGLLCAILIRTANNQSSAQKQSLPEVAVSEALVEDEVVEEIPEIVESTSTTDYPRSGEYELHGTIAGKNVEVWFGVNTYGNLTGAYKYTANNSSENLRLSGSFDFPDTLVVDEYYDDEQTGLWKLKFTSSNTLEGTIINTKGNEYPIHLVVISYNSYEE